MTTNSTLGTMHTVLPATLRAANRPDCACFLMVQFAGEPLRENDGDAWIRQQPCGVKQASIFKNPLSEMAIECASEIFALENVSAGEGALGHVAVSAVEQGESVVSAKVSSDEGNSEGANQHIESHESSDLKAAVLSSEEPAVQDGLDMKDGNEDGSEDEDEEEECCNESDQEGDTMPCAMG